MQKEEKDISLRNDEINEILTDTPKWIFRWGMSVVFILISVFIALSYFIKYPDVLIADIELTTLNPPVTILAKNNGKLTHLLVKDKQFVNDEQLIAVIENTADYKDVLFLLQFSDSLNKLLKLNDSLGYIHIKDSLKTGEITPYYLQLLKSIKDINLYININAYNKQIELLRKDLLNHTSLLQKYQNQHKINDEQLKLAEIDYLRDKKLFEEKAITAREFENQKKNYLTAQNSNEQSKITISNALIQINSIEKNILQLQIQDYQEKSKLKNELLQQIKTLSSEINKWKQLYIIESLTKGKISFLNLWTINQNIKQEDELFAVVPEEKQKYIGKCLLSTVNSGKLKKGQSVNIKLDNYPYNENGILNGIVYDVSEVPTKDNYIVIVELPYGLTTSYKKKLTYKEQMKGKADIITDNISVMDRIFFNFKKLAERN